MSFKKSSQIVMGRLCHGFAGFWSNKIQNWKSWITFKAKRQKKRLLQNTIHHYFMEVQYKIPSFGSWHNNTPFWKYFRIRKKMKEENMAPLQSWDWKKTSKKVSQQTIINLVKVLLHTSDHKFMNPVFHNELMLKFLLFLEDFIQIVSRIQQKSSLNIWKKVCSVLR